MLTEEETIALVMGADSKGLYDLRFRTDLDPRARMPDGEGLLHYGIRSGRLPRYMGALGLAININGAGLLRFAVEALLDVLAPFEDETAVEMEDPKDFWRTISAIDAEMCKDGNERIPPYQLLGISAEEAEEALAPLRASALAQPGAGPWNVEYGIGSFRAMFYYRLSHSLEDFDSPTRRVRFEAARAQPTITGR